MGDIFEYDIDDVSLLATPEAQELEVKLERGCAARMMSNHSVQIYLYAADPSETDARRVELLRNIVGTEFSQPSTPFVCTALSPLHAQQVYVFGELISGRDFEYDNLFTTITVEDAPGWTVDGYEIGLDGCGPNTLERAR